MHAAAPVTTLALLVAACAQLDDQFPPTTDQVVQRMLEADAARLPALRNYTSFRSYTVDNKRFGVHATMQVRVTYRYPGDKQFEVLSQSGPAAIRTRVFKRMLDSELAASRADQRGATQISPDNYTFRLARSETIDDRPSFVLEAEPRTKNPLLFKGLIWVDAVDYAVTRIEARPAQNPSFWVQRTSFVHRYVKQGPFWLALSNHSTTDVRIFGRTEVRIEYADYKINQGLDGQPGGEHCP